MIQDGQLREFAMGHAIPVRTGFAGLPSERKTLRRRDGC